jgi:hypothetical protein
VTGPSDPSREAASEAEPAPAPVPAEPRQRWRITLARGPVPADQVGRAGNQAWTETLAGCGLPVAGLEPGGVGRPRIAFAAPLPAAARGEAELAELWLLERVPGWRLREALASRLPSAHEWIAAEDVWLGAPALAGRVVAADWRIEVAAAGVEPSRLADAAERLVAARTLPRVRVKAGSEKAYDLRPLLEDVAVAADAPATGSRVVRIRTRFDPELGSGRPDEIVAARADEAGIEGGLAIESMTRERLLLDDAPAVRRRR